MKGRAGVCQGVRTDLAEKVQVLSKDIAWSQLDWEFSQIREICDKCLPSFSIPHKILYLVRRTINNAWRLLVY